MKHIIAGLVGALLFTSAAAAQTVFIRDAELHTMSAAGVIENGDILIRNGVIVAVGADLQPPAGARIIEADGKPATPGLIAAMTQIGLTEIGAVDDANDARVSDFDLGAALKAADAINPTSTLIPINRAGGVTRAVTAPASTDSLFSGLAAFVHLGADEDGDIIVVPELAMIVAINRGAASRAGGARVSIWAELEEALDAAIEYHKSRLFYNAGKHRDQRFMRRDVEALGPVVRGDLPLVIAVHRADQIRRVIQLKEDYDLDVTLIGAREGWRVADAIAEAEIPVIIDGLANLPGSFESLGATLQNAAKLHAAGVDIAIAELNLNPSHNAYLARQIAGNAVANGLPYDAALASITRGPAVAFGLEAEVGSLEVGRAGDVVIWSGDPLELSTHAERVLINGADQDLTTRSDLLAARYRDMARGALPFAYRGE